MDNRVRRIAAVLLAFAAGLVLPAPAGAVSFDFGDAPDGNIAYETAPGSGTGVVGRFPSLGTSPGPRHALTTVRLGTGADREGKSRQLNIDNADDGFRLQHVACREVRYSFTVNVRDLATEARRGSAYLNLWIDWNADGDWEDVDDRCGPEPVPEHRVQNHKVDLAGLRRSAVKTIVVKRVAGGIAAFDTPTVDPTHVGVWVRASVTPGQKFAVGQGGRAPGQFRNGETEDYGPVTDPRLKGDADFGDAPDSALHPPACRRENVFVPCQYPSLLLQNGARHYAPGGLFLGPRVDAEGNSRQVDKDTNDDGFKHTLASCGTSTFEFALNAQALVTALTRKVLGRRLSGGEKAFAKMAEVFRSGRFGIFLNVWVDLRNDDDWADPLGLSPCRMSGDWVLRNHRLSRKKVAELFLLARLNYKVTAPTGEISDPNGCIRASITPLPFAFALGPPGALSLPNDGRGPFRSPVSKAGGSGETEDYCPPLDPSTPPGSPGPGPGPEPDPGIKEKTVMVPIHCPGAGTVRHFSDVFVPAGAPTVRHRLSLGMTELHAADGKGPHSGEALATQPCGPGTTTVLHDGEGAEAPTLGGTLPAPAPPSGDKAFRFAFETTRTSGSGPAQVDGAATITYDETP